MTRFGMLAVLAVSRLPASEGKAEPHVCPTACIDALGLSCPKGTCAGYTAQGDEMTCSLDQFCLDGPNDPYGGLGCGAGINGAQCRFCGFSSDGVQFPPCVKSAAPHKAAAAAAPSDACPKACLQALQLYCPKVCGGPTSDGADMTCMLDEHCLDVMNDPYGGLGCNAGSQGQHCRYCGFEADGIKFPPCAGSVEFASFLAQDPAYQRVALPALSYHPRRSLTLVLLGGALLAAVAVGIAARRRGVNGARAELLSTGLLSTEAGSSASWEPAKLAAESAESAEADYVEYDRLGK